MARAIKTNAKIIALREALKSAFAHQISEGLNQKAVVFTESKRTQKYIAAELRRSGYSEEDILLFNGDFDDAMTKEIFRTWQVKNFGKTNYGRSVEYKHAIVDYFKSHAKILIVTDAGSEGLNLQFCNTIINYDLSSVHSMGFRQFIFYLAHKVDFIAEIFLCTMILFGNVGAQPAASFLLKFASFAKFLKQPESLCCFCTNQIFNFFSCNTAVFQCILKNE